jgi:hypothetical protein
MDAGTYTLIDKSETSEKIEDPFFAGPSAISLSRANKTAYRSTSYSQVSRTASYYGARIKIGARNNMEMPGSLDAMQQLCPLTCSGT